jgi:uncharacterized protein YcbX
VQVIQLWRYPVKSMLGHPLREAHVGDLGIDGDRQWGLVDADTGLVLTARRVPQLLFATPLPDGDAMQIRLPDGTETDDDDLLSAWLGRPVSLRRPQPDERGQYEIAVNDDRPGGEWIQWQGPKGVFHDSKQTRVSIISEEALGEWDTRRFRPNVVVRGGDERELVGHTICIGDVELRVMKQIDRCVIVTRPQPGLERDKTVLQRVHAHWDGDLGVGALVRQPGTMRIGDPVRIS